LPAAPGRVPGPFTWPNPIDEPGAFFNRHREWDDLSNRLANGESCQILGPRRIGKTSLLRQVKRGVQRWRADATVCYVDLQDIRCSTLSGWLEQVAQLWEWKTAPRTQVALTRKLEALRVAGHYPILCLDEFEKMARRRDQFTQDFFSGLRFCCQNDLLSVVTTSQRSLSELTNPEDPTVSPFYNCVVPVEIGLFTRHDSEDFVNIHRPGLDPFTKEERSAILDFARDHPLALQVACHHLVAARRFGDTFDEAIEKARVVMERLLPSWPDWRAAARPSSS
jgi:hypothetical protein